MYRGYRLNAFDLDDDEVSNDQVSPEADVEPNLFPCDRDGNLSFNFQRATTQFVGENGLANGFEQTGTQSAMNGYRSVDNLSGE